MDVQSLLLSFENRLETTKLTAPNTDGSQPSVHFMNHSTTQRGGHFGGAPSTRGRGGYHGNRGGYIGGRGGHNRGGFSGGRGRGRNTGSKPVCQVCFVPGHTADRCWHRYDQNFVPKQHQQSYQAQSPHGSYTPSANVVQHPVVSHYSSSNASNTYAASDYNSENTWYPDSGATNHVSNDLSNLNLASEYQGVNRLQMGNGQGVDIAHIGKGFFVSPSHSKQFTLNNLLHVPNITKNLLSVSQFARDNRVFFEFHSDFCLVKDQVSQATLLKGILKDGLYQFVLHKSSSPPKSCLVSSFPSTFNQPAVASAVLHPSVAFSNSVIPLSLDIWHNRMGHCNVDIVRKALNSCNVSFNEMATQNLCQPCYFAKMHRLPYQLSDTHHHAPLELIHSDLWGPAPITSANGFTYYVSFIDQHSRYVWIYLLKAKSEVHNVFLHFKTLAETQLNTKIKSLQTDWGGEYRSLSTFFIENGIHHKVSCPYTPQQNGLAERKHRHIVETGLSLLFTSGLPMKFWDDAFTTAVYLINRLPTKAIQFVSPLEKLFKQKPNYASLRTFRCLCYPFLRLYNKHKLQLSSDAGVFLGYSAHHKGYKVLLSTGKIIVSRDVIFYECVFPHKQVTSPSHFSSPDHNSNPIVLPHFHSWISNPVPSPPSPNMSSPTHMHDFQTINDVSSVVQSSSYNSPTTPSHSPHTPSTSSSSLPPVNDVSPVTIANDSRINDSSFLLLSYRIIL